MDNENDPVRDEVPQDKPLNPSGDDDMNDGIDEDLNDTGDDLEREENTDMNDTTNDPKPTLYLPAASPSNEYLPSELVVTVLVTVKSSP